MNRHDEPAAGSEATEPDLDEGFDAVMAHLDRLAPHDVAGLSLQADAAELGHEAYALGLDLRARGNLDRAAYWLQTADRHHVTGARRALEELEKDRDDPAADAGTAPTRAAVGGVALPASHSTLAHGVPASAPGTIFVLGQSGGLSSGPGEGRQIVFGRGHAAVHLVLGEDDPRVSRRQGTLTYEDGRWQLRNTGRLPIRISHHPLNPGDGPFPLADGYTQVLIRTGERQHLLEIHIAGREREHPLARDEVTRPPLTWPLSDEERLVLTALGRQYLEQHPAARPLSWREVTEVLAELQPAAGWTAKRVEHRVAQVRTRLSRSGIAGLTGEEVGEPVGAQLNHNLLEELLRSNSLVPRDLALINAA
ncbi:hypothetical protein [Amycolatopsis sp. NPDC051903]|uniref:hypothetical protein n=1 Tax=Amycolatopsis sp. NPDC051903 TaxID=3363936 RepID=UPI003799386F